MRAVTVGIRQWAKRAKSGEHRAESKELRDW